MKTFAKFLAVLAIVGLVGVAEAAKGDKAKPAGLMGKVVKVDGTNLVLKTKTGEVTVATDANTKVQIDGADGKLADLKEGMGCMVSPETGTAATIKARTAAPGGGKKPK